MGLARKPILVIALAIFANCGVLHAETSEKSQPSKAPFMEEARNLKQQVGATDPETSKNPLSAIIPEESKESSSSIMRLFQGLAFCLGVFFIGLHVYKKYIYKGALPTKRSMRVLERLSLGSKSSLILVEIESKKVLVAVGAEKLTVLESNELGGYFNDALNYETTQAVNGGAVVQPAESKGRAACAA